MKRLVTRTIVPSAGEGLKWHGLGLFGRELCPVRFASSSPDVGDPIMSVDAVTKVLPGHRTVLKDVACTFLEGAKIGVVGPNGAGKSTLLRILAGEDREFDGTFWRRDGCRVGFLAQEPVLDPAKDVHGNIMDGLKFKTDLLDRFNEISHALADPNADFDKVCACFGVGWVDAIRLCRAVDGGAGRGAEQD
jgi:hypothetical protein